MPDKTCNTCGETFLATTEFFHAAIGNKDGLNNKCKKCIKTYNHERHARLQAAKPPEKKKKYLIPEALSKVCPECGINKNKEEGYWKSSDSRDGYGSRCKDCSRKTTEMWRDSEIGRAKSVATQKEWRANNPDIVRAGKKRYRERNPEKVKAGQQRCWEENGEQYRVTHWRYWLNKKYGLTEERYYEILKEQNYQCAICGATEKDFRRQRFCVDHCHDTGVVRGMLCFACNVILGNAHDNPELLESAVSYLKKFPKSGIECGTIEPEKEKPDDSVA